MSLWARMLRTVAFAVSLVILLAGCAAPPLPSFLWQTHTPQPAPDARQVVHISLPRIPSNAAPFDPAQQPVAGYAGQMILSFLYSDLFTLDVHGDPTPSLAMSYAVSGDGLRYTLHLRPHARFSDGSPITSADVVFSLNHVALSCSGSDVSDVFSAFKGQLPYNQSTCPHSATLIGDALLAPDPATVVIILSRPDGALLSKLAESYSGIVEQSFVQQRGEHWWNLLDTYPGHGTSGMYQLRSLATSVSDGTMVTLERSTMWWGARPRIHTITMQLRAQHADLHGDIVFDQLTSDAQQPGDTLHAGYTIEPTRTVDYIALDPAHGFVDVRLRQALALALDKTALATLLAGQPTNHLIPAEMGAYPNTLSGAIATTPLSGDTMGAQALWQSYVRDRCGGEAARCPAVLLWWDSFGGPEFSQTALLAIKARWEQALPGIRIQENDPPDTLMPQISSAEAVPLSWFEDYPDPQDWLQMVVSMPGASNWTLYHEPQADALVTQAEATHDPSARLALYHQAEMTLINDAVVIPLAQHDIQMHVGPTVLNLPPHLDWWISPDAWANVYVVSSAT